MTVLVRQNDVIITLVEIFETKKMLDKEKTRCIKLYTLF